MSLSASASPPNLLPLSDRELLRALAREPSSETFLPILDRYLRFVYAAALRQLHDPSESAEATRAVFLAFARRGRRLSRKTLLAGWLFQALGVAVRRVIRLRAQHPTGSAPLLGGD